MRCWPTKRGRPQADEEQRKIEQGRSERSSTGVFDPSHFSHRLGLLSKLAAYPDIRDYAKGGLGELNETTALDHG